MNCCFDNKIKNFEELKLKYDGYNELEKLSMDRYISAYFKEIIDRKYINYYDDENVNHILWIIYLNRLEGDSRNLEIDIVQNMKYAIKIKELRDEDIRNGKKISTIYDYEQRSFYNDYKIHGRVRWNNFMI